MVVVARIVMTESILGHYVWVLLVRCVLLEW